MKVYKLTDKAVEQLYLDVEAASKETLKRYTSKDGAWEVKGKDNLGWIEDGYYEISNSLFDRHNQFKGVGYKASDDFENAKLVYTELSDLTASEANDARFWTRLTHEHFHNYTLNRWYRDKKSENQKDLVKDRSFFIGNSQRTRTHNSVARLWWIPFLTVRHHETDEEKKWELTKAIFEYQELHTSLLERKLGTYENVRIGFLEYYIENKKEINSAKAQSMLTSLNNYGGVTMLSMLEKDNVKDILRKIM